MQSRLCATCGAATPIPHVGLVGDRLTVGQRTLTPPVLVRIQVPQPLDLVALSSVLHSTLRHSWAPGWAQRLLRAFPGTMSSFSAVRNGPTAGALPSTSHQRF